MNHEYDLAIVGAGIIGLWVARLALKNNPHDRILMVDQSLIGHGTTQYSLGLNYVYGDTPEKRDCSIKANALWHELFEAEPELFWQKRPLYVVIEHDKSTNLLPRFSKEDIFHLPGAALETFKTQHPWFRLESPYNIFYSESYQIPSHIAFPLMSLLKQEYLFDLYEGMKLTHLSYEDDRIHLKTSSNDHFYAEKLVLALGPWTHSFLSNFLPQAKLSSLLKKRYIKKIVSLHFEQILTPISETDPIFFWPEEPAFLIPNEAHKQWVLSIKSDTKDCSPNINELFITEQDKEKGFTLLDRVAPDLKEHFRGGRVFCDIYSDDMPQPELIPELPYSVVVGAGSGIGFRLAPQIAFDALKAIDYLS